MTDRTISASVDEDVYEKFHEAKEENGATNAEMLEELVDRYNGKRRPRPPYLPGVTQRFEYPRRGNKSGKCYVNLNVDPGNGGGPESPSDIYGMDPFEIFITVGDSGGVVNSWAEALAKTLSNALRAGVNAEVLADDLKGIRGPYSPAIDNGDYIYSVPDGVGIVMERFIEGKVDPPESVRGTAGDILGVED